MKIILNSKLSNCITTFIVIESATEPSWSSEALYHTEFSSRGSSTGVFALRILSLMRPFPRFTCLESVTVSAGRRAKILPSASEFPRGMFFAKFDYGQNARRRNALARGLLRLFFATRWYLLTATSVIYTAHLYIRRCMNGATVCHDHINK